MLTRLMVLSTRFAPVGPAGVIVEIIREARA
jgi:hypothetical protein